MGQLSLIQHILISWSTKFLNLISLYVSYMVILTVIANFSVAFLKSHPVAIQAFWQMPITL